MSRRHTLTVRLRAAVDGDGDLLAAVFLACWRRSYAGVLPPEVRSVQDPDTATALWSAYLRPTVDPDLVVVTVEDRLVGMAVVRATDGYLASLYVDPDAQRCGAGRVLFAEVVRRCDGGMRWWVFAANAPGIAFYELMGGVATGRTRVEAAYGVPEIEMSVP